MSDANVMIDGEYVTLAAYNILGNNYFKLRDLASVFNGKSCNFEVLWVEDEKSIIIKPNTAYTSVGGELIPLGVTVSQNAILTDASDVFMDDGIERKSLQNVKMYNVNGNNYIQLRGLAEYIGYFVDWDEATRTVIIETNK